MSRTLRRKKSVSPPTLRTRRRPASRRPLARPLALALLWVVSLAGLAYGFRRLDDYARALTAVDSWRIEWVGVPATVDDWVLGEIEAEVAAAEGGALRAADFQAPDLCRRLAEVLGRSPWVAEVHRVSKRADGVVEVRARIRQYVTYVVRAGRGYLVDGEGVRLPREEGEAFLDQYGMILIEGVEAPVPAVGEPWADEAVLAGLDLVRFLERHCPDGLRDSLKAVDVSNYGNRRNARDGWLSLRTVGPGGWVRWGLPPGEEYDIESPASRKLEMLWSYYAQHGQLGEGRIIDVRGHDEVLSWDAP